MEGWGGQRLWWQQEDLAWLSCTYWSASATTSGSGGGIIKQTPGALMASPVLSVTSQTSPLFFCRV